MDDKKQYEKPAWFHIVAFAGIHILAVWGIIRMPSVGIIIAGIIFFLIVTNSVTIGAHRYFTHRAFRTSPTVAKAIAVIFSASGQGSLLNWVVDHQLHHKYEDVPGLDPHTPKDGFYRSHIGWMMIKRMTDNLRDKLIRSFKKPGVRNEVILWQGKHYFWLMPLMVFVVPTLIGWALGDALGGFLFIGCTRLVFQWHSTWSVNSIGHKFGKRIEGNGDATNYAWLWLIPWGLLTGGEANHANHHLSPSYWRLGRRWWDCDTGAVFISLCARLKLMWGLKEPASRSTV